MHGCIYKYTCHRGTNLEVLGEMFMWQKTKSVLLLVLLIHSIVISYCYLSSVLRFAQTYSLIRIFDSIENDAKINPEKSSQYADYIKHHYPKGTLFDENSQYEWIVEKCRNEAVNRILKKNACACPKIIRETGNEESNAKSEEKMNDK